MPAKYFILLLTLITSHFYTSAQEDFICKDLHDLIEMESGHHSHLINHRANAQTQDYDVKYHRLEWEVDPAVSYIKGTVTTYFVPTESGFNQINFDLVDSMTINQISYHSAPISHTLANDNLQINLPDSIPIGTLDSIVVSYEGAPANSGLGAFAQGSHNGEPTLWTLSEPYGAKSWWPCKQDLIDKIDSIDIFVTTPQPYRVGSNGLLISEISANGNTTYHWRHRYAIPAYLISLAVANYETFTDYVYLDDGDSITILNYVYSGDLATARNQLANTVDIMEFFNDRFGLYPFADEKYGHAQFGWGGGMEHQTMSSMGGFSYGLQAHELAHQWFGDKVTCGSWQDIWLNEGFATYLAALTLEELTPNPNDWDSWKSNAIQRVTNAPGGSTYVIDTTDVNRIFNGRLTYTKGAMILHMLRWTLGDENFFQGVQNYLNDPDLAYGYARTADLQAHLEQISGDNLTEFFNDWLYGQGYPSYIIDYTPLSNGINFTISQTTSHPSVDFFEMPIPIKVFGGGTDTTFVIQHTFSGQGVHFDLPFVPDSIQFDPEQWIISKDNSINLLSATQHASHLSSYVTIFPNPVFDMLHIELDEGLDASDINKIIISDLQGRERKSITKIQPTFNLSMSQVNPGMYFLSFYTHEGVFTKLIAKY